MLSIRKDFLGGLLGSIFASVGIALAGAFLAAFIFLRTLWRRGSAFRALAIKKFNEQRASGSYTPPGSGKQSSPPAGKNDSPVQRQ